MRTSGSTPTPRFGECGTRAAVPALATQIHHAQDDVKWSAIHALAEIGDEALVPVLLNALTDWSWAAKGYAIRAIARHGNAQAIGPVCDRVRAILARQRKINEARRQNCWGRCGSWPATGTTSFGQDNFMPEIAAVSAAARSRCVTCADPRSRGSPR